MTDRHRQSRLDSGIDEAIPSKSEVENALDEQVSDEKYRRYFKPYFEFFATLDPDERISENDVYEQVGVDVKKDTKRKYLKKVFEYQPALGEQVVDQNPSAEAFLERALERTDIEIEPDGSGESPDVA